MCGWMFDELFPCTALMGQKNYFFGNDVYRQNIDEFGRLQHFSKKLFFKKFLVPNVQWGYMVI